MKYNHIKTHLTGIYMITCIPTKHVYIGSSKDIRARIRGGHLLPLNRGTHDNSYLQNSWNKYGADSFKVDILELCEESRLVELETKFVLLYNSMDRRFGYNIQHPQDSRSNKPSPKKGVKMSEEQKIKISETLTGRKIPRDIVERAANSRRGKPSGMKGKTLSSESRKKLSESKKGRKMSEEQKNIISSRLTGKKKSEEHCRKMSESKKGRKLNISDERRKQISEQSKRMWEERRKKSSDLLSSEIN